MTDSELNLAIHQEVEGWQWNEHYQIFFGDGTKRWVGPAPDYCNNPVWCVQMMEKHKISVSYGRDAMTKVWQWWAEYGEVESKGYTEVGDLSLTRAVALVVLQLTREANHE